MDTVEKILQDHANNEPATMIQERVNALLERMKENAIDAQQRHLFELQSSMSELYWIDAEEAYSEARNKLIWLTTL